jgi:alanine dehydrogenase
MPRLHLTYLNALDIEALALSNDEILAAIEAGLAAQGRREAVIEPRMHLVPDRAVRGHFNVLRGALRAPINLAGVKVISDYVENYKEGLPSEVGLLLLMDPGNGVPKAIIDGSHLTDMRTGAVTAIGAKYLARKEARVLGHVGARGTAYWNVRLLDHLFDFGEIRVHSRRPESRNAFAARLTADLGKPIRTTEDWRSCVEGADIVVEASRLAEPQPLLRTEWIAKGTLVVPYGTMSAVELLLTDIMDKIVVDDWGQCKTGQFGALRAHVEQGKLSEATLLLASRPVVVGHCAGPRHAREGRPRRDRPAPALRLSAMPALIANARMYAVTPAVEDGWRALFAWLSDRSAVPLVYADHPAPAPLRELWSRGDLGAAFMCGLPFASAAPKPSAVAAPIPSPPRYGGAAIYCTDLIVRAGGRFSRLSDVFGKRIGWTLEDSQSGFNAVRRHLLRYQRDRPEELFASWVGPLVTPRRVIEAVLAGDIDVGPLDSYVHDLLKRHEPETASRLRTIESTEMTPIPPLVASASAAPEVVERLRCILLAASGSAVSPILHSLLLEGFAPVDPADYARLLS